MTSREKLDLLFKNVKENFKHRAGLFKTKDLVLPQLEQDIYNDLVKEIEVLEILKNKPFILQKIFENKGLSNQEEYDKKYFWGTIDEDEYQKVKEWLEKKDEHTPSK